jgi:ferric-dicitrate binding protein FerR (iron transport regulator)
MRKNENLEDAEIFARTVNLFLMATEAPDEPNHTGDLLDWLSESPRHIAALEELGRFLKITRETLASMRSRMTPSSR